MSKHISFEIALGGAAFEDSEAQELARILREYADKIEKQGCTYDSSVLRDINGNRVGQAWVWGQ
jgi:hypothetical protein